MIVAHPGNDRQVPASDGRLAGCLHFPAASCMPIAHEITLRRPTTAVAPRGCSTELLLVALGEASIGHGAQVWRLPHTRAGKLILTK